MATHPLSVKVMTDRNDLLEIRWDTCINPRYGTHPEHTSDTLSGTGMIRLDVNPVPLVAHGMLAAEPRQRVPEILDQPILEPAPRAARLGGQVRGEADQVERDVGHEVG
jgi:hypothetical protein